MPRVSATAIAEHLSTLPDWSREGDGIRREFLFDSFTDAMAFANRLALEAEHADHHPDLLIRYRRVTVTYTTHSASGLTEKDFEGARTADRVAGTK